MYYIYICNVAIGCVLEHVRLDFILKASIEVLLLSMNI